MEVKKKKITKKNTEWIGTLLGWVFVIALTWAIVYYVRQLEDEGELVCDRSVRASLTSFGSCHMEKP